MRACDYCGWVYAVVLTALCALMIDIAINRARVTTRALNAISIPVPPC